MKNRWLSGALPAVMIHISIYSTAQAVRKLSFYALWFMLFINISSGISLLAVASPMLQEKFPLIMTAAAAAAVNGR